MPALIVSEAALKSMLSRTYARVWPETWACGSITPTAASPPLWPPAVAVAVIVEPAVNVAAPVSVSEAALDDTCAAFAPANASTLADTIASFFRPWMAMAPMFVESLVASATRVPVALTARLPPVTLAPSPT